jgi:hypothetical protein
MIQLPLRPQLQHLSQVQVVLLDIIVVDPWAVPPLLPVVVFVPSSAVILSESFVSSAVAGKCVMFVCCCC